MFVGIRLFRLGIVVFKKIMNFVPDEVNFRVCLPYLPIGDCGAWMTFASRSAAFRAALVIYRRLVRFVSLFPCESRHTSSTFRSVPAGSDCRVTVFRGRFLPSSDAVIRYTPELFTSTVSLETPPIFPIVRHAIAVRVNIYVRCSGLVQVGARCKVNPLRDLVEEPRFRVRSRPVNVTQPGICMVIVRYLSVHATSPVILLRVVKGEGVLINRYDIVRIQGLAKLATGVIVSPCSEVECSYLTGAVGNFLRVHPFRQEVVLYRVSRLRRNVCFLAVNGRPIRLQVGSLQALFRVDLHVQRCRGDACPAEDSTEDGGDTPWGRGSSGERCSRRFFF